MTANTTPNFLSLPSEIRNRIYELVLVHDEPVHPFKPPWSIIRQELTDTSGLFRASKTIHREASSMFYMRNHFDFTNCVSWDIASFLQQISSHAAYIRHIRIDFPRFGSGLKVGKFVLGEESANTLANIRSDCPNLSSLTTSLFSTSVMEDKLGRLRKLEVITEMLRLVNTCFRAISPTQELEIIVEVYEDSVSAHIRDTMRDCGWTISTMDYAEGELQGVKCHA